MICSSVIAPTVLRENFAFSWQNLMNRCSGFPDNANNDPISTAGKSVREAWQRIFPVFCWEFSNLSVEKVCFSAQATRPTVYPCCKGLDKFWKNYSSLKTLNSLKLPLCLPGLTAKLTEELWNSFRYMGMIQLKALWGWGVICHGSLDSDNLFSSSSFDVNQSFPGSGACSIILRSCNRLNWADFDLTCGYWTQSLLIHMHLKAPQKTTPMNLSEQSEQKLDWWHWQKNQSGRGSPPVESCRTSPVV